MTVATHRISQDDAKRLVNGDLGDVQRGMLADCMLPIYWHESVQAGPPNAVLSSGTLTVARTKNRILGLTAAHVVRGYEEAKRNGKLTLQLMNATLEDLNVISISDRLDLAAIDIPERALVECGKAISPMSVLSLEKHTPQEGRGIMFGGYPAIVRQREGVRFIDWGMFGAIGVARRVTDEQITWVAEREFIAEHPRIPNLPPNTELGGISGGPMAAWFEKESGLSYASLVGVVSQASASLENVVAKRLHFMSDDGLISAP